MTNNTRVNAFLAALAYVGAPTPDQAGGFIGSFALYYSNDVLGRTPEVLRTVITNDIEVAFPVFDSAGEFELVGVTFHEADPCSWGHHLVVVEYVIR